MGKRVEPQQYRYESAYSENVNTFLPHVYGTSNAMNQETLLVDFLYFVTQSDLWGIFNDMWTQRWKIDIGSNWQQHFTFSWDRLFCFQDLHPCFFLEVGLPFGLPTAQVMPPSLQVLKTEKPDSDQFLVFSRKNFVCSAIQCTGADLFFWGNIATDHFSFKEILLLLRSKNSPRMALIKECSSVYEDGVLKHTDSLLQAEVFQSESPAFVSLGGGLFFDAGSSVGYAETRIPGVFYVADVTMRTEQSILILHDVIRAAVLLCKAITFLDLRSLSNFLSHK